MKVEIEIEIEDFTDFEGSKVDEYHVGIRMKGGGINNYIDIRWPQRRSKEEWKSFREVIEEGKEGRISFKDSQGSLEIESNKDEVMFTVENIGGVGEGHGAIVIRIDREANKDKITEMINEVVKRLT